MLYKFISKDILLRVIIIKNDSFECKAYNANLVINNDKNNLYHTIRSININELRIWSGYIY